MSRTKHVSYAGLALGLVTVSWAVSVVLCSIARHRAALGIPGSARGAQGAREPTPLGGGVAIWLTTVSVLGFGLWPCDYWARTELPEPLARHVGGVYRRSANSSRSWPWPA